MGPGDARGGYRRDARRALRAASRHGGVDAFSGDGCMTGYTTILVEQRGAVTLVTLNRPQALNALNSDVLKELIDAFAAYDSDPAQRCLVLTGSEKAFAAGADIKEMQDQGFADMYSTDFFQGWEKVTATRKPWIAAVAGYALGGGCEVAMMADFIIAADSAKFGQPEIKLGVTPGMGGSQRLTRAIGKAKAMEMCLTGRMMGAEEAEQSGLVARVVPADKLLDEALATAEAIAGMAPLAAIATKEMVNAAILIDCATIDVATAKEEIQKADAAGYRMVDAPVSGGIAAADAGTLTFMVGGTDEAFERARPILEKMGKAVIHAGGPGSGQ